MSSSLMIRIGGGSAAILIGGFIGHYMRMSNTFIYSSLSMPSIFLNGSTPNSSPAMASTQPNSPVLMWQRLEMLDYKTGTIPTELQEFDGRKVRIPGFSVPLTDDNLGAISEFLLVPNDQACIHVPPPPPNLIVHVKLMKAIPVNELGNPLWVEGTLHIESTTSIYGSASYNLEADSVSKFDWEQYLAEQNRTP